ncbi:MAG: right-handed parallel beta-helix repeat-containing protein [Oceanipulchritudo sp.]
MVLPTELGKRYDIQYSQDLMTWQETGQWCYGTGEPVTFHMPFPGILFLRAMVSDHAYQVYFVSPDGDDSNSGVAANAPFVSIQKAADMMQPGDVCYLRGGVYREMVVVPVGPDNPQEYRTFRSYPGERATLRGDVEIPDNAWSVYSGQIYMASWSAPVSDLYIEDEMVWTARWPDATSNDPLVPEFSFMDAGTSPTIGSYYHNVTDQELTAPAGSLVGAKVWFTGKERWWARAGYVYSHNSTGAFRLQIPLEAPSNDLWYGVIPAVDSPYFLYDHPALLDAPGEWYHDDVANILYLWTPDGSPPAGVTSYTNRWIFDISGCRKVRLMDLEFFSGSINAVDAQDCVLENLKLRHMDPMPFVTAVRERERNFALYYSAGYTGIPLSGSNNLIQYCEISHSWGDAVCIDGTGNTARYNQFHDLNYYGTMAGVSVFGAQNDLIGNSIWRMGRSGVRNDQHAGGLFEFNHIHNVGRINWDVGGIYMYNAQGSPSDRLQIRNNLVHNVQLNNNDGPTNYQFSGSAIYVDGSSSAVNIYLNVCYDYRRYGVQLNGDSFLGKDNDYCDIAYNTLIDSPFDGLSAPTGGVYYQEFGKTDVQFRYNVYWATQTITLAGVTPVGNTGLLISDFAGFYEDNYQLVAGAPAIDAGMPIAGVTDGYLGAAPDTGAFEFGIPGWEAGIPAPTPAMPAIGPLSPAGL